jgi:hypothetical protein
MISALNLTITLTNADLNGSITSIKIFKTAVSTLVSESKKDCEYQFKPDDSSQKSLGKLIFSILKTSDKQKRDYVHFRATLL